MKTFKIKVFAFPIQIVFVVMTVLVCFPVVFSQEIQIAKDSLTQNRKCSPVIEQLEFCADSTSLIFKLGEKVNIPLSLHNTTKEEKFVKSVPELGIPKGTFTFGSPPYEFIVTDESGKRLPTIEDDLAAKQKNGTITAEESNEQFSRCCINKGSRWGNALQLAPDQEYKFDIDLNLAYNFRNKGKYYVEIQRNVLAQNRKDIVVIRLEKILFEIQ